MVFRPLTSRSEMMALRSGSAWTVTSLLDLSLILVIQTGHGAKSLLEACIGFQIAMPQPPEADQNDPAFDISDLPIGISF